MKTIIRNVFAYRWKILLICTIAGLIVGIYAAYLFNDRSFLLIESCAGFLVSFVAAYLGEKYKIKNNDKTINHETAKNKR